MTGCKDVPETRGGGKKFLRLKMIRRSILATRKFARERPHATIEASHAGYYFGVNIFVIFLLKEGNLESVFCPRKL